MTLTKEEVFAAIVGKLKPLISELDDRLHSEGFDYKRLKWEQEAVENKRKKAQEDLAIIQATITEAAEKANLIISDARKRADEIIAKGNSLRNEGMVILESIKGLKDSVDKKRFNELREAAINGDTTTNSGQSKNKT